MSKVFIVRFSRYSIYKVQCSLSLSRSAFTYYHIVFHLSRTFFKFFQISSCCFSYSRRPRGQLAYINTSSSICQYLFSIFFKKIREPLSRPPNLLYMYGTGLFSVVDQAITAILTAIDHRKGSTIVFIPESKEIMFQQVHLQDCLFTGHRL